MRAVQFAQHLAQHVTEIVLIINIRQEPAINVAIAFPVYAVDVLNIELVLHLLPDMVENVGTLLVRTIVELCLKGDGSRCSLGQVDFLDAALRA